MAADEREERLRVDLALAEEEELEQWEEIAPGEHHSLVELINRVLDRGVVITGDITISVAGVDLVYLSLNALLTSVSTARRVIDPRIGAGRAFDPGREG